MATQFKRLRDGRLAARTDALERAMLVRVLLDLCHLVKVDSDLDGVQVDPLAREMGLADLTRGDVEPPDDPVLRRLLPDGYPEDDEASAEFRRFTDASLRGGKVADAEVMIDGLRRGDADARGRVVLSADEAQAWLRAINDLRLAIGTQLGVTAAGGPDPNSMDDDDPDAARSAVYEFLTWWQDTLVRALVAGS